MRLIIAGSRSCDTEADYQKLLQVVLQLGRPDEIISGGAKKGGDRMGELIAKTYGIPLTVMQAQWQRPDGSLDKGAGFIRNGNMAVYASEQPGSRLIALWDGMSKGTAQMMDVAKNYGLDVVRVEPAAQILAAPAEPAKKPYIFKQSHSSLNVFETCPRQYYAKYVSREVKFVQNPKAKWGDDVHKALESFLLAKGAQAMPSNMTQYQRFGEMMLERAARFGGTLLAERSAAVKQDRTSTFYSDKSAWLGGKIDVTIHYPAVGKLEVFDWKTGKVKNDVTQLKMYAGFGLADFPDVQVVRSGFVWLEEGDKAITPPLVTSRPELPDVWGIFQHKYNQLEDAYVRNAWPEKPNGLCKQYCDVVACAFHGKGRY